MTPVESSDGDWQARALISVAHELMLEKGGAFTTQEVAKRARVPLRTFYRLFDSKDRLLLAVWEDLSATANERYAAAGDELDDPVERLRLCMTAALDAQDEATHAARQFITGEYWRLYQLFPAEMTRAAQRFVDLVERRLREAVDAGRLQSRDPRQDAWLMAKLIMGIFHHRAFAPDDELAVLAKERAWAFCLAALGAESSG